MVTLMMRRMVGMRSVVPAAVLVIAGSGIAWGVSSPSSPAPHPNRHASARHEPQAHPAPSLRGLCHAYQAGVANGHGKKLTNPAFSSLVSAAGGKAGLAGYCTDLIGARADHGHGRPDHVPPGLAKQKHKHR
jgi:hypothetical protein